MLLSLLVFSRSQVEASFPCPGSPSSMHASCEYVVQIDGSCESVKEEMLARVQGQYKKWHDPHNNGTYTSKFSLSFVYIIHLCMHLIQIENRN